MGSIGSRLLVLLPALAALVAGCEQAPSLAYLDEGEVYLWQPGSEPRPLAHRDDVDTFFWSPSGRHIAYRVAKPTGDSFWCFTGVDTGVEVKTRSKPLFSAVGRTVAYIKDLDQQLILLDEAGGEQKLIAEWVWAARWNPSGTVLAYVEEGDLKVFELESGTSRYLAGGVAAGPDFVTDDLVLFISDSGTLTAARTDGSAVYRLVEEIGDYYAARDYSGRVHGSRLVCVDQDRDAYLMDFDGANQTRTGTDFFRMAWDSTGSRFFLIEDEGERMHPRVFSASGDSLLEVKDPWDTAAAETLAWSSGSDELAFVDGAGSLYVIDLDGAQTMVAKGVYDFAWVPYRRQLVVLMPRTGGEGAVPAETTPEGADSQNAVTGATPVPMGVAGGTGEPEVAPETSVAGEEPVKGEPAEAGTATVEPVVGEEVAPEGEAGGEVPVEAVQDATGAEEPAPIAALPEIVPPKEADTAVYLYDLEGTPRKMLSRSGGLPILSPRGRRFLTVEPLRDGLYNAVVSSMDEDDRQYLGKFRTPVFPAAWQPEGLIFEGRLVGVLVTLALVAIGIVALYLVIRRILLQRRKSSSPTQEAVPDLEDSM
ncbi:MAG: hypothetical protein NTW26_03165 [bacterium]|nr:hypothetical protein [bacterium]